MTIVSHAQNFEDVILWRAFKNVKSGFYIDVGANDPVEHSVTKLFYDAGWTGINIEPIEQWFLRLEAERPKDTNLQVAAGATAGSITLYEIFDTGLSTNDKATAEHHKEKGGFDNQAITVPARTLNDICTEYALPTIHFLKIDVEGAELHVLRGLDLAKIRPWVILVESTKPLSVLENYSTWDPLLTQCGYKFAYFDGLNRFYIADEMFHELADCFKRPPNVFDDFELARVISSRETIGQLTQELVISNEKIVLQDQNLMTLNLSLTQAEVQVEQAENRAMKAEVQVEQAENRAMQAEAQAEQAENLAMKAEAQAEQAENRAMQAEALRRNETNDLGISLDEARQELHEVHQSNHHFWQLSEARAKEITALHDSLSWRLTAPLRWIVRPFIRARRREIKASKSRTLDRLIGWGMTRPRFVRLVHVFVDLFPPIRAVITRRVSVAVDPPTVSQVQTKIRPESVQADSFVDYSELSPRAWQIYSNLKEAAELKDATED